MLIFIIALPLQQNAQLKVAMNDNFNAINYYQRGITAQIEKN